VELELAIALQCFLDPGYVDASTPRFRWNHNPRVGGSSPSSATTSSTAERCITLYNIAIPAVFLAA